MSVSLVWATPDIDRHLAYIARVSNPDGQTKPVGTLLEYMLREGHSSPFEMANVCMEINTTRDIARQILRHRSFSFQEFSQRYQDVSKLGSMQKRECRMQDPKNRQNSVPPTSQQTVNIWEALQFELIENATRAYRIALDAGIAKEQARALLPEGLTPSRVYMNGTMRSWIFYLKQRLHPSTQKEHRQVAEGALAVLRMVAPVTVEAVFSPASAPAPSATDCSIAATS